MDRDAIRNAQIASGTAGDYYPTRQRRIIEITKSGVRFDTKYEPHGPAPVSRRSVVEDERRQSGSTIAGHLANQPARRLYPDEVNELTAHSNPPEFPDSWRV